MKIAIITLYDNGNLGAALQAYALGRVLRDMGHECEHLRYTRLVEGRSDEAANRISRMQMLKSADGCGEFIFKAACTLLLRGKRRLRRSCFNRFISENIIQSDQVFRGSAELAGISRHYDCCICGSDNIWNKLKFDPAYYLDFVPDGMIRFSYAAGLSASSFSDVDKSRILPLVERLDAVSVRDSVGRRLLEGLTDKPVREDLDPTMLLSDREWRRLSKTPANLPQRYIFCYLLGNNPRARRAARLLKEKTGLPIVTLPHATTLQTSDAFFGDIRRYDIGPAEFLSLVSGAEYVVTDSFHGCVFSILFQREFAVFRRFKPGPQEELNLRLDCVLEKLNLPGRIIYTEKEALELLQIPTDYSKTAFVIDQLRLDSLNYLKQMTQST